ncbi:MAG: hypothetical protein E4H26_06820, partial [Flavobacteriales bacterium]
MTGFRSLFILFLIIPLSHFGQMELKWNKQLPNDIQWQEVTALGNLIVSSSDALMGIDTDTGEVNWSIRSLSNLGRQSYEELPNSPFFTITTDRTLHLIDQFSGKE